MWIGLCTIIVGNAANAESLAQGASWTCLDHGVWRLVGKKELHTSVSVPLHSLLNDRFQLEDDRLFVHDRPVDSGGLASGCDPKDLLSDQCDNHLSFASDHVCLSTCMQQDFNHRGLNMDSNPQTLRSAPGTSGSSSSAFSLSGARFGFELLDDHAGDDLVPGHAHDFILKPGQSLQSIPEKPRRAAASWSVHCVGLDALSYSISFVFPLFEKVV